MFLVNAYKTIEPALAGASFGTVPTFGGFYSKKKRSEKYFAVTIALSVLGCNALSPKARVISALAVGTVSYFLSSKKIVHQHKEHIAPAMGVATAAVELYKGQRLYPISKIAGIAAILFASGASKKTGDTIAVIAMIISGIYALSLTAQGIVSAACKFVELSRRTKLGYAAAGTVVVGAAAYYYFKGGPSGPGGEGAQAQKLRVRRQLGAEILA